MVPLTGTLSERTLRQLGDIVVDRDRPGAQAVVVKLPNAVAEEWRVPGGTVADTNPEYPADERVVVVVFRDDLEERYPRYTGGIALALEQLNRDGVDYYSFPAARLRRVGQLEPHEIALNDIDPCPYHARNFNAAANRDYIEAIRERGRLEPAPLVRDCGDRFEILNGHKRVWASYVAGLESIPCDVHYQRDLYAARTWARRHLSGYSDRERRVALRRIESNLDVQQASYIDERL
ncbi:ParB N-terminal domain-containing protein [Natronorubrum halophilum]|uniref:ParB N-terminal domain-containing protein n=1 Tax=Natronorubrum halophilum TaxID=1702106 RepID=UPI001EE8C95B|nr:ParB N-terminal domain-containing protein [Natronorubrum halophilum]